MRWFFAFFLVSGFCALVYEIVWLRLAMAAFGVTTPLVSLVLAVFMAGLGLGSWAAGGLTRMFDSRPPALPLRVYGLTELFIGASGLSVPVLLDLGHETLVSAAGGRTLDASVHYAVAGSWIALTLLPWCIAMGATLPIAMAAIRRTFGDSPRSFSYLYLANVLGAVMGTLVPAFVLIELLGFRGTLRTAAALNLLLGLTALGLAHLGYRPPQPDRGAKSKTAVGPGSLPAPVSLLWLLFGTGLVSLAMEVVWIRQFTPYLGTVVYAFATILSVYLFATFVGSRIYRVWSRSRDARASGWIWMTLTFLALLPLATADPRLQFREGLHIGSFLRILAGVGGFSAAAGFLTPMLVDRWSGGDARRAGKAYAVNVLGSVLGPLLAGFVLLPLMSERIALGLLALPLVAVGFLASERPGTIGLAAVPGARGLWVSLLVISGLVVGLSTDFEGQFTDGRIRRDSTATVIATGRGMEKQLLINGRGMTSLTPVTKMMVHLPLSFLDREVEGPEPREALDGLIIAFGMGTSFRSMLSWDIPSTAVELVPSVVELFDYYHDDAGELLASPLARVVIDDGRRYLERSAEAYDVVIIDPPPPVESAGTSLLYSKDFYTLAKRRLKPGGILQQWLYLPFGDLEVRASVARALTESFPYVRAFQSLNEPGLHFLASMDPIPGRDADALARRLPPKAARDLVEWGPHPTPEAQFAQILDGEIPMGTILDAAPHIRALEDDWALNEYYWYRRTFR